MCFLFFCVQKRWFLVSIFLHVKPFAAIKFLEKIRPCNPFSTSTRNKFSVTTLTTRCFRGRNKRASNPISAERAEGVYLWDRDGKRYLDFSSQLMNVNIGHGDQRVTEAVAAQMRELSYIYPGMITKARGDLGRRLNDITAKNLTKSFFTLGGGRSHRKRHQTGPHLHRSAQNCVAVPIVSRGPATGR